MIKLERYLYDIVKKNTIIKNIVRDVYQGFFSFFASKESKHEGILTIYPKSFFGFHDKVPWNSDNSKLLSHRYSDTYGNEEKNDAETPVEIGFYSGSDQKFTKIADSYAWNWQQGSMLQWVGLEERIIFNTLEGGKAVAQVYQDLSHEKTYQVPIGSVSPSGRLGLSWSFSRLDIGMPGYGYFESRVLDSVTDQFPDNDGIYLIDFNTDRVEMLFSLDFLQSLDRQESMLDAYHFVMHGSFSPDSSSFFFLHRWMRKNERIHTRLLCCAVDGSELSVLDAGNWVSHLTWCGNDNIFAYCEGPHGKDCYYLIDKSGSRKIIDSLLSSDGHPQYSNENGLVVFDTYPNRARKQRLALFNLTRELGVVVGEFYSPSSFKNDVRCDLHPRWDRVGNKICFDSAHSGARSLCVLDLSEKYIADVGGEIK